MAAETARKLRELPKGDALATAQLAGIMAAKRTSELIPLCHPLPLTHIEVTLEVGEESVEIVSALNFPASIAAMAFRWLSKANASWSSRLTPAF